MVDQFPALLKTISEGTSEFEPSPMDTKEVCRRMYRARNTLVLKFAKDTLDESEIITKILREANTIMRMKRPMVEMKVDFREITGSHITPLTPNLEGTDAWKLLPFRFPDALNPSKTDFAKDQLLAMAALKVEILSYLQEHVQDTAQI